MSEGSSASSSSESSSDTDDETIQDMPDEEFFKTLSCLKKRDPRIYDSNVQIFTKLPLVIKNTDASLKFNNKNEEEEENKALDENKSSKVNHKFSLKDLNDESCSEDEISALKGERGSKPKTQVVPDEYVEYLKGKKPNIDDKEAETTFKPLHDYWNTQALDDTEKFLKEYLLNKKYLSEDADTKAEEDLSEDERDIEEQAEYEANYNFRFENEVNLQLKRYPRTIEGSLRRKNDSRSKKRTEIAQRKKEEKLKKQQDIKKKQKEKLSEIEERLQKLKELTGNAELGFKDDEILEEFDPEKHDQRMKELFNDDYYNEEDAECPVFDNEENYWNNEDINMDCDADVSETNKNKLTRTQKKKLRKRKTYTDIMDLAKPSFDPKIHSDFKKYIDEFYSLDCEDFIDDLPCKFKYREVVPNDYGLSIEEILMADDNELNRWASVKKITRRQPEHVEKNEVKIYKKKAQDDYLKKKLLPSLYAEPEEPQGKDNNSPDNEEKDGENIDHSNVKENSINSQLSETASNVPEKNMKKKRKRNRDINNLIDNNESLVSKGEKVVKLNEGCKFVEGEVLSKEENIEVSNVNNTENIASTNISKKKKRRKKKKKSVNNGNTPIVTQSISVKAETNIFKSKKSKGTPIKKINENGQIGKNTQKKTLQNKVMKKFGFKRKKEGVVNLSDNRLKAYGIKPKQFRSKILYS